MEHYHRFQDSEEEGWSENPVHFSITRDKSKSLEDQILGGFVKLGFELVLDAHEGEGIAVLRKRKRRILGIPFPGLPLYIANLRFVGGQIQIAEDAHGEIAEASVLDPHIALKAYGNLHLNDLFRATKKMAQDFGYSDVRVEVVDERNHVYYPFFSISGFIYDRTHGDIDPL